MDIVYIVEREPQIPDGSGTIIGVFLTEKEALKVEKDYENSPYKWEIYIYKMKIGQYLNWEDKIENLG